MKRLLAAFALSLLAAAPALALDELVTKRTARIPDFTFESGETIPELVLGVETYGQLDATGSNAILVCHYFMGDSHAAGRYTHQDAKAGWWDAFIGSGRAIDTDRFFVVCIDIPCSMRVKDDTVVTTGPATIDPRTGSPYAADFPELTVLDIVRSQRAVLDALGVQHLRAATGPSLGGMIALQYAITYPDDVDLVVPVGAPTRFSDRDVTGYNSSAWAIRSDPYFFGGDYYSSSLEPNFGVANALYGMSALAKGTYAFFLWNIYSYLGEARELDANHYLRILDLHADYELGAEYGDTADAFARIHADIHWIGFLDDDFITPDELREQSREVAAQGAFVTLTLVHGGNGHLSAVNDIDTWEPEIRDAFANLQP